MGLLLALIIIGIAFYLGWHQGTFGRFLLYMIIGIIIAVNVFGFFEELGL